MDGTSSVGSTGNGSGGNGNIASPKNWDKLLQYVTACSQGADPAQAFAALTEGHEHDPRIQALAALLPHAMKYLSARSDHGREEQFPRRDEHEAPSGTSITDGSRQRRTMRKLLVDVETSRELLARLAMALGACTCFGNPVCNVCRGEGRPGRNVPDAELFEQFIAPAVSRRNAGPGAPDRQTTRAGEDQIRFPPREGGTEHAIR